MKVHTKTSSSRNPHRMRRWFLKGFGARSALVFSSMSSRLHIIDYDHLIMFINLPDNVYRYLFHVQKHLLCVQLYHAIVLLSFKNSF